MNTRYGFGDAFVCWVIIKSTCIESADGWKGWRREYLSGFEESGPQWTGERASAQPFINFADAARERHGLRELLGKPSKHNQQSVRIFRRTVRSKKGDGGP